jgi:two-component system chemotaxis response regulator CheY
MNRCLVVDDSSIIRKVARHILENSRYQVAEAENGEQALEEFKKIPTPDVILLDWHLPLLSAMDVIKRIRAIGAGKLTRIIYCTTENDPDDIAKAFAAGADDYLMKPFTRDELLSKIKETMAIA